jgi:hypothetical protein
MTKKKPTPKKSSPKGLSQKAMLVSLHISQWPIIIEDSEATKKTAVDNTTDKRAISVRKRLLRKKGAVAKLQKAVSALRKYHTHMTLPWAKGVGILKSSKFTEYSTQMRQLINDFKTAVHEFLNEFPDAKQDAEQNFLGNLWKDRDYPDTNSLQQKFDVGVDTMPIPQKGDWRVDLSEEQIEQLNKDIETKEKERTKNAMEKLWVRVYEPVKHMVGVLNKDNPKIFETLITNISDLVEILPDLNLVEDPKLESLRQEIDEKLCGISTSELKDSKYLREDVVKIAEGIRQKIKDQGGIKDEEVMEMMNGYVGNEVIKEFGKPVYGQEKIKMEKKED